MLHHRKERHLLRVSFFLIITVSVGDSKGDEGENATVRHFHPRSHENQELEDEAVLLRQATIFSEGQAVVNDSPVDCQSRDRPSHGEKPKSTRLFSVAWSVGFFAFNPRSREARVKSTVE